MRVKISTNPPLPPVKAWFPLSFPSAHSFALTPTISSFKSVLCTSLPVFRGVKPSSLHLSIDGFELLDDSELTVVRDGDLICVDSLDVSSADVTVQHHLVVGQSVSQAAQMRLTPTTSHKRKRRASFSESSHETESSASSSTSRSSSESSESDSDSESSDSDDSMRSTASSARMVNVLGSARITPSVQPKANTSTTFVPPGFGKPQTRSRNLRRRQKRVREREATEMPEDEPASGSNAVGPGKDARATAITPSDGDSTPTLLSLSLRNKNKARNFKSLINRPLAPKIVFGDQEEVSTGGKAAPKSMPQLIPPSSRSSLPANMFVTSVNVEEDLRKPKKKQRVDYGEELEDVTLDYGEDVDKMESVANARWDTLEKVTREKEMAPSVLVGCKALGINPVTYTPEECVTLGRVESHDLEGMVVRPLREEVSFSGPMEAVEQKHTWGEIEHADWRIIFS